MKLKILSDRSAWSRTSFQALRAQAALLVGLAVVGTALGGLLIGYEPVGGDPDRLYRPVKSELARGLREGSLPFWSRNFGLGVPLVAESHVAAFYPPNLLLYRVFDVSLAYRLAMWLHYIALVITTYFYARCLGITTWGGALAGVSFTLCGFQAIHSSHEPFYCLMPYLPLALAITERYMASGRTTWLALLALTLGVQWTLGHFQIQMWTNGLVILSGLWRAGLFRRLWVRALAVAAATAWGAAVAAVQLGLSWQFANLVGQTKRSAGELIYYSFPPLHWFELVAPRPIRELKLGPEDPYWFGQQTWGYEAALYVGTIPLIAAFIGLIGRPSSRPAALWRLLVPISFALATMPRWWPQAYLQLLALPGIGYFRVPARYTLLTSFGLAMLAGEGLDRSISPWRFGLGLAGSLVFGGCGAVAALIWAGRPDVHLAPVWAGMPPGLLWSALAWLVAIATVVAWRFRRLPSSVVVCACGIELGVLFYLSTTQWGRPVSLPAASPLLRELAMRSPTGLIGGLAENLPVRVGLATASPYLGFALPRPNESLKQAQERFIRNDMISIERPFARSLGRWLRRNRVEYLVVDHRSNPPLGRELGRWRDPALDLVARRGLADPIHRVWSITKLDAADPEARVATRARTISGTDDLFHRLIGIDDPDLAHFLVEDGVAPRADARSARLISWNRSTATVEHDGTCDLVIARTYDPGWRARVDDGPEQSVLPVDGGLQAVRVDGSGTHRVVLRYEPRGLRLYVAISATAIGLTFAILLVNLVVVGQSAWRRRDFAPLTR